MPAFVDAGLAPDASWAELAGRQHGESLTPAEPRLEPEEHRVAEGAPTPAASGPAPFAAGEGSEWGSVEGELQRRLSQVEAELESSIAVLFEQIGRIDDKLDAAERRMTDELAAVRSALESLRTAPPSFSATGAGLGQSDIAPQVGLNAATFDDLRHIGLSVTQAARIVAFRDTHGPFGDFGELEEIRGLSEEDLRMLRERTTL